MSSKVNTGRWTDEEHDAFVTGLKLYGNRWREVKRLVPTRSIVQIRTHAQKYFIKLAKEQGVDPSKVTVCESSSPPPVSGMSNRGDKLDAETPKSRLTGIAASSSRSKRVRRPKYSDSASYEGFDDEDEDYSDMEPQIKSSRSTRNNNAYAPAPDELSGLPIATQKKAIPDPPEFPDISLRHIYLEPVQPTDSIGISLHADPASSYVRVDELPRLRVRRDASTTDAHAAQNSSENKASGNQNGNHDDTILFSKAVEGVAEKSGAVKVGDCVVGICGVPTTDLPPRAVGQMIAAARSATVKTAITIHLSSQPLADAAFPIAVQHMRDAAAVLFGDKLFTAVSTAAQEARTRALKESAIKFHTSASFTTATESLYNSGSGQQALGAQRPVNAAPQPAAMQTRAA